MELASSTHVSCPDSVCGAVAINRREDEAKSVKNKAVETGEERIGLRQLIQPFGTGSSESRDQAFLREFGGLRNVEVNNSSC